MFCLLYNTGGRRAATANYAISVCGLLSSPSSVRVSAGLNNGLPTEERVGNVVDNVPSVGGISLVRSDCDDVPACS
jgi:hypothetical protein